MGRTGVVGADRGLTASAALTADAGAPPAEAPSNVNFRRIGGRLSWRPHYFRVGRKRNDRYWHFASSAALQGIGRIRGEADTRRGHNMRISDYSFGIY